MTDLIRLKKNFLCPYCKSNLRVWNNIIFSAKLRKNGMQGLLLLHPELGNYSCLHHPSFEFSAGEIVDFFCSICHEDLTAHDIHDHIVKILMLDDNHQEYGLYFTKIAGDFTTFITREDQIIDKYGENISDYLKFFKDKFKNDINR